MEQVVLLHRSALLGHSHPDLQTSKTFSQDALSFAQTVSGVRDCKKHMVLTGRSEHVQGYCMWNARCVRHHSSLICGPVMGRILML